MGNGSLWEWEETRFLPTRVGYKGPVYDPVNFLSEFAVPGSPGTSACLSSARRSWDAITRAASVFLSSSSNALDVRSLNVHHAQPN